MTTITLSQVLLLIAVSNAQFDELDFFRQTCPYTDLCTIGRRYDNFSESVDVTPCCSNCYCNADCWKFNDCCPDAHVEHDPFEIQANCVNTAAKTPASAGNDVDELFPSYRIFDRCPDDFNGSQSTIDKCAEVFTEIPSLNDLVLVSNTQLHDEIYKNKHCASCNGVEECIRWDLNGASCADLLVEEKSITTTKEIIWNECFLFSTPPKELNLLRPLFDCSLMDDPCTSDTADPDLKRLCADSPYFPVNSFNDKINRLRTFKNPYCFECIASSKQNRDVCPLNALETPSKLSPRFTILLNIMETPLPPLEKMEQVCKEHQLLDHTMDRCRTLFCPWNKLAFYGKCINLADSVKHVNARIRFLFRPVHSVSLSEKIEPNDKNAQNEFAERFKKVVGLDKCQLQQMIANIYTTNNDTRLSFLVIDLIILVSNSYSLSDITDITYQLALRSIDYVFSVNRQPVQMTGNVIYAPLLDTSGFERNLWVYLKFPVSRYLFTASPLFACPYFKLNLTEYNRILTRFGNTNASIEEITPTSTTHRGFFIISKEEIVVCTSTYFESVENEAGYGPVNISYRPLMVAIVLYQLLF